MKAVFIGSDSEIAENTWQSMLPRWPEVRHQVAATAVDGLDLVVKTAPDVVIIHPSFTDMSLPEAILGLRAVSEVPLVVLAFKGDDAEAEEALEMGADDYVAMPCDQTEMMARVYALLRRATAASKPDEAQPISCGQLIINPATRQVLLGGQWLSLSPSEFQFLHNLGKNVDNSVPTGLLERAVHSN